MKQTNDFFDNTPSLLTLLYKLYGNFHGSTNLVRLCRFALDAKLSCFKKVLLSAFT